MIYSMIDFTFQLIAQLPVYQPKDGPSSFGFRKIWTHDEDLGIDKALSLEYFEDTMRHSVGKNETPGLEFNSFNFNMQLLNCVIIAIILLQADIFNSYGYKKFVTQTDGSLDLLIQLADLKSKSKAYIFNN